MVINQGDVFWVDLGEPSGSRPGLRRPFVVVQNDLFNRSRLGSARVAEILRGIRLVLDPRSGQ